MNKTYSNLPGWEFAVLEVSMGVYEVRGKDLMGHIVSYTGTDPYELLELAQADALAILGQKRSIDQGGNR